MYIFCDTHAALQPFVQESFAKILGNPVTFHADLSYSSFLGKSEETTDELELALKAGLEQSGVNNGVKLLRGVFDV